MIDFASLRNAIVEQLDERILDRYDLDIVLKSARIVWDGTAVEVRSKDFVMVFDLVGYECLDYTGYDA